MTRVPLNYDTSTLPAVHGHCDPQVDLAGHAEAETLDAALDNLKCAVSAVDLAVSALDRASFVADAKLQKIADARESLAEILPKEWQ